MEVVVLIMMEASVCFQMEERFRCEFLVEQTYTIFQCLMSNHTEAVKIYKGVEKKESVIGERFLFGLLWDESSVQSLISFSVSSFVKAIKMHNSVWTMDMSKEIQRYLDSC